MPDDDTNVKSRFASFGQRVSAWVDCHPRTGWYISALLLLNTVLNLIDLFHN